MITNNINDLSNIKPMQTNKNETIDKNSSKDKEVKKDKEIVDKFEKSEVNTEVTYKKPIFTRDEEAISKIRAEVDQINSHLRSLVEKLLKEQGMTFKDLKADGPDIKVNEETRLEAQKSIDEGGELSIENVSDRMVNFAKAISGGDKSKISILRDAIEKGFKEAEEAFGGELPEISYKTLERTMEKLDAWENE